MVLSDTSAESVFVGCYTEGEGGHGSGISVVRRDPGTGALGPAVAAVATPAPSYVALHPTLPVLYAVNELDEGTIGAFAVSEDFALTPLGGCRTGGAYPCHLDVSPSGRQVVVANYGSGSVTIVRLDDKGAPMDYDVIGHSGRGPHPERQQGPHAHMIVSDENGVLAVDLGTDTVYRHRIDPGTGEMVRTEVAIQLPPGTGPRHLVRDPSGRIHVVGELNESVLTFTPKGDNWEQATMVRCTSAERSAPSAMAIDPAGRFLYVANRGPDTIAVLALDRAQPALVGEVSTGGSWPRDIALVGPYLYVANERSHTVVTFRVDPTTGLPRPTGDMFATPSPTCVLPDRHGQKRGGQKRGGR